MLDPLSMLHRAGAAPLAEAEEKQTAGENGQRQALLRRAKACLSFRNDSIVSCTYCVLYTCHSCAVSFRTNVAVMPHPCVPACLPTCLPVKTAYVAALEMLADHGRENSAAAARCRAGLARVLASLLR